MTVSTVTMVMICLLLIDRYTPLPPVTRLSHYENYLPVLILKDLNVAWTDRNWYLHEQDLVYLDERLGAILISRGIARKTEVH